MIDQQSRSHGSLSSVALVLWSVFVPVLAGANNGSGEGAVEPLVARASDLVVRVVESTACCPATVKVSVQRGGSEQTLYLSGRLEKVHRILLAGDDRLLLAGELPRGGGTNLLIANLATLQQEQSLWNYGYGVSPSGRWLAYQTHYPRMVAAEARRSIFLLYDLSKPPEANRSGPESDWPEPNLGQPIFPEENVERRTWDIFAAE